MIASCYHLVWCYAVINVVQPTKIYGLRTWKSFIHVCIFNIWYYRLITNLGKLMSPSVKKMHLIHLTHNRQDEKILFWKINVCIIIDSNPIHLCFCWAEVFLQNSWLPLLSKIPPICWLFCEIRTLNWMSYLHKLSSIQIGVVVFLSKPSEESLV